MPVRPNRTRTDPAGNGGSEGEITRARVEMAVLYCLSGEANYRSTKTVEVGVSGALLILPQAVNVGQSLLLINPKISKQVACRVCYIRQKADGYNLVGVEF